MAFKVQMCGQVVLMSEVAGWAGQVIWYSRAVGLSRLLVPHSPVHHKSNQKMSALHSLGLYGAFGNPSILGDGVSLHQWVINIIKENNLNSKSVTNGLLHDLLARLVMKHHRHAQHDPKRQLTKAHIAHIVGFMICRMGLEEVTPKFVRTVWNYIPFCCSACF